MRVFLCLSSFMHNSQVCCLCVHFLAAQHSLAEALGIMPLMLPVQCKSAQQTERPAREFARRADSSGEEHFCTMGCSFLALQGKSAINCCMSDAGPASWRVKASIGRGVSKGALDVTCSHVDSPFCRSFPGCPIDFLKGSSFKAPGGLNFSRAYLPILCSALKATSHQLESLMMIPSR